MVSRAHVYIRGRVQGVFFRAATAEEAHRRGLRGWVRNCFDGRVEAVFEGAPEAVTSIVAWCHEGPPHARVDSVIVDESEPAEGLAGFEVRSTA